MAVEIIDISTLVRVETGSDNDIELRYYCPLCPVIRGKADQKGKLYWSLEKNCGYCFYCNTTFFPKETFSLEEGEIPLYDRHYLPLLDSFKKRYSPRYETPKPITFPFNGPDAEVISYLENRNPYLPFLVKPLGFHKWAGKDSGVVIPIFFQGKIVKFQVRFFGDHDPKYYTSIGPKPFYSPKRIFDSPSPLLNQEILLCEGVFDAIALSIWFPDKTVLAVLGKTLTNFQIYLLRNLAPRRITITLDEEGLNNALYRNIERKFGTVEKLDTFDVWSRQEQDPEEFFCSYLRQDKHFSDQCEQSVQEWRESFYGKHLLSNS